MHVCGLSGSKRKEILFIGLELDTRKIALLLAFLVVAVLVELKEKKYLAKERLLVWRLKQDGLLHF